MNFVLQPSLEHIALVKIVAMLWNQNDVKVLIEKIRFPQLSDKEWQKIEDKVIEKVSLLPQLGIFTEKIVSFIKPIGLEILKWMKYHCTDTSRHFLQVALDLPSEFCWTPQGTIDGKKTAEVLIKFENLDAIKCYKLACIYCLEDDILGLWNKIPNNLRGYLADASDMEFMFFWTHVLKKNESSYKYEFDCSVRFYSKVVVEYFFKQLTSRQREDTLLKTTKGVVTRLKYVQSDVLCFLLSQMNEQQQTTVFKSEPYEVLQYFLEWPFQSFFIEVANRMWDFLSKTDFDRLLQNIIDKIKDGYKDCDYKKLFEMFWQESPNDHKSYIADKSTGGFLLSYLFQIKDKGNLKLLLQNVTHVEKKKLIYSNKLQNICQDLICDGDWDLLRFLIKECLPSEDEMIKFKEEYEERVTLKFLKDHLYWNEHKWNELFLFFDDSVFKNNKRKYLAIGESHPSKTFCRHNIKK